MYFTHSLSPPPPSPSPSVEEDVTFQVATLVATGRKILVGTTSGVVGLFDSETLSPQRPPLAHGQSSNSPGHAQRDGALYLL